MNPFPKTPSGPTSEEEQLMQLLNSNPELMQKYQEELTKFQSQSKSQHSPMTSQEYIEKLSNIEQYFDSEGGLLIEPFPAFVLTYQDKRTKEKIFVNVLTHDVIDHPEEKLLVDYENQPGLRIPMSMGRVKEDHDKSNRIFYTGGNICKVIDVVLNPLIVQTCNTSPDILGFTAQIIGNYLLEKYKIAVAEDVLSKAKKIKYKGSKVEVQRVKGRKAPKIHMISEEETKIKQKQQEQESELLNEINEETLHKKIIKPDFEILAFTTDSIYEPYSLEVGEYRHLKILIDLPHLIHSKGIHLEASQRLIYLLVKNMYEICLKMPFDIGRLETKFSRKQRKLQILVYKAEPLEEQEAIKKEPTNPTKTSITPIKIENDLLYDLV